MISLLGREVCFGSIQWLENFLGIKMSNDVVKQTLYHQL